MRAQLICVRGQVEADIAERLGLSWDALSAACHYHTYELGPTAAELRCWHEDVGTIANRLAQQVR